MVQKNALQQRVLCKALAQFFKVIILFLYYLIWMILGCWNVGNSDGLSI